MSACTTVASPQARLGPVSGSATVSFILVPHAETTDAAADDPPLSAVGQARAEALRAQLAATPLTAIYVDQFRRTQDTAAPVQQSRHRLPSQRYFSLGPLWDTARQWRRRFGRGTVLVVGQPEAIAPLGNALCDCNITPVQAGETDRLVRIERTAAGSVRVEDGHYGNRSP